MILFKRRYKLMGPAVIAGLGSVAGGLLGKAIMGSPQPIGPDTSVPGITSATIQKAGKSDPGITIAQINPNNAIDYFKQAATQFQTQMSQGMNIYNSTMGQAINSLSNASTEAKTALNQMILSGQSANSEYMKMLGLTPPSKVQDSGLIGQVSSLGYNNVADLMSQNENLTDSSARASARQQALDLLNQTASNDVATSQAALTKAQNALTNLGGPPTPEQYGTTDGEVTNLKSILNATKVSNKDDIQQRVTAYQNALATYNNQKDALNSAITTAQAQLATSQSNQSTAKTLGNQYGSLYGNNAELGYTGDQVRQKLEQTPGYQFSLGQGNQAISRAAAAGGLLASGNTYASADKFSQGLAQQMYQGYLNNLSPLINAGNQGSSQLSNNILSQGGALASIYGNAGTSMLNAYQNIGQAYNNAYTNAGQTTYNASQFNAAAQNQAINQKNNQNFQAALANQNNALQAGYLNLANSQFNYQVAQNQQAGQTFANGAAPTSYGAGSGYPYLNYATNTWSI